MATQASDSIGHKTRASSGDDLAVIAQRAQAFTNASGAAIAVGEGNNDEIVCRARSGSSAPDVGTALRVEGSFTGLCIQSGKELRCDDAETDTRVDTSALRSLGIRSMVVTPIREEGKITGVLAVFAPTPHAFTITHVAVLKTMADQISAILQKEQRTKNEVPVAMPVAAPVPVAAPKPVKPAVPLPPPVVIKPALSKPAPVSSPSSVAAAAPARSAVSSSASLETRPLALADDITAPVPFPRREEKRERKDENKHQYKNENKYESSPVSKAGLGTLDAVAGEPARSSTGKVVLVAGVMVAALVAGLAWFHFSASKPTAPSSAQNVQQPVNSAPAASAATTAASNPAPSTNAPVTVAPVITTASNSKPTVSEKTESKKADAKKKPQQETPAAPTTVALNGGTSKIAQPQSADQSSDVAPSLAVGGGSSSGLASLARPVASSTPSMMAHSELINSKSIRTVPAAYPEMAKASRLTGVVVIRVTVGKDGKVKNPVFVSGPGVFRDSAFTAVKQWLFQPAQLNGQPIEQDTEIRMKFASPD